MEERAKGGTQKRKNRDESRNTSTKGTNSTQKENVVQWLKLVEDGDDDWALHPSSDAIEELYLKYLNGDGDKQSLPDKR